ncbi:MAG: hypothetical protein LBB56_05180 [Chitinispirillales bacterium]|jgi:hypothetical protein|nr:hypothetical protein [Chitinispirillales bacterium]
MAETVNTVVAQLIDEVTPAVQRMQNSFGKTMDELSGQAGGLKDSFKDIDKHIPDFGSAVSSLKDMAAGALNVGGGLAAIGANGIPSLDSAVSSLKDMAAGSLDVSSGLAAIGLNGVPCLDSAVSSLKGMAAESVYVSKGLAAIGMEGIPSLEGIIENAGSAKDYLAALGDPAMLQGMAAGMIEAADGMSILKELAMETGNAYIDMGMEIIESLTEVMGSSEEIIGNIGEYFDQFKEDALSGAVGFSSAISDIGSKLTAAAQKQVDTQRRADIEKVKNSAMSEEEKQKAIDEINKKAEAEKKKLAMAEKAIAISKAAINTALAIGNALTTTPFPAGLVMAGVAGAMGAAQVAAISAQSFEQGGIVPGTSFTGDQIAARVNSGEMILNRSQQSQLFAMANGAGGGGGGGSNSVSMGGDTIVINGNADSDTVEQIRQTKQQQIEDMRELLKEMKYHGQLEL